MATNFANLTSPQSLAIFDQVLGNTTSPTQGAGAIGFSPALPYGTGTVGLALAGFVSATSFGADPTGIADCTAAIVAASQLYKFIYFPPGTYKTSATITIPDNSRWIGAGPYATTISLNTTSDIDAIQIGWFTNLESMTVTTNAPNGGSKGVIRLQSLTNPNIPTNVGGNNWTNPAIGGLSYKNVLRDVVATGGQNYSIFLVNPGYIDLINVRAVLSRGAAGNLNISGNSVPYGNLPQGTTVTIIGGEYTASSGGPGISANHLYNSVFINQRTEGNFGRGLLLTNCGQIRLQNAYVENNFALGASLGDGDIVITGSNQISIDTPQIVSSNSAAAIATSSCSNCMFSNYQAVIPGGTAATLSLDAGWVSSSSSLGIIAAGTQSGGRWVKYADGTAVYSKKVSLSSIAIATSSGSLFVQAAPQSDTDFPAIFMSDGAAGFVFSPTFHCMANASGVSVWAVSAGVSTTNNALRYRLACATTQASISVDVYITMTGRWQ